MKGWQWLLALLGALLARLRRGERRQGAAEEDDEVKRCAEFLDHVSAEDFDNPGDSGQAETWPPGQE